MRTVLPATVAGIEKYLGSGLIKGVGPVTAKRIVKQFGVETLNIIEETPGRLIEVPSVGRKRTRMITEAWEEQRAIKEVMIFLQSYGVTTSLATKIYKYYGDDAINIVRENPYRLARDIYGIGFLTADKIARAMGLAEDAPQRVAAGVAYALNQATDDGHVFLPSSELMEQAAELLGVAPEQTTYGIVDLWRDDQVKVAEGPGEVEYTPPRSDTSIGRNAPVDRRAGRALFDGDQGGGRRSAGRGTRRLSDAHVLQRTGRGQSPSTTDPRRAEPAHPVFVRSVYWDSIFETLERSNGFPLAPQQRQAVETALTHRLTVLTGGPGTGKTTTVRTILQVCQQFGRRVLLAAPTGRAAKRLSETTGEEAKTIHRLLEFKPSEGMAFKRNEESPLEGDLLIVDEASMLDLVLTNHLLKAVPPGMHLLLVGDVDQLPSVGAGNVLKDVIGAIEGRGARGEGREAENVRRGQTDPRPSPLAPRLAAVIRLQTIFRQAAGSYIITNAHRINHGDMPVLDNERATDFFLFRTDEPERGAQLCVELVTERIPRRFGIPSQDIQVLSPMHRGLVGVGALNGAIQAAVNPPSANKGERTVGNRVFRVGDRVIQMRNNYDKDVYNGDMGIITQMDLELQKLAIDFDGRVVPYDFLELDELTHAFAISVHKSQGSEFPAVVIPVMTTHYMMLQRNLLYTAVTRARRLVVLVGQPKAIALAVRNNKVTDRHSGLRDRLERGT